MGIKKDKEEKGYGFYENSVNELSYGGDNDLFAAARAKQTDYDTKENDLIGKIDAVKSDKFAYSPMTDDLYMSYADLYMKKGQLAAKNAIAESSILTGGYGNSWAQSAGMQAYGEWMEKLEALIPELRAAAYDEWEEDREKKISELEAGYDDLEALGEDVDSAWAAVDAEAAGKKTELVNLLSEGYISGDLSEDDIYSLLGAYDDTYTDEDMAEFMSYIKANSDAHNAALEEADRTTKGIMADIVKEVIKNPDLGDTYIGLRLEEEGISADEETIKSIRDAAGTGDNVEENDDVLKSPTGSMREEAAELYKEKGYDGLVEWKAKYPEYDLSVVSDYVTTKYADFWQEEYGEDGIVSNTKPHAYKDRQREVIDNGGLNHFGGLDRNAIVRDQYGEEYTLINLARKMVEEGEFETIDEAKEYLEEKKYGVKGGILAKEE